jgi:hypothetical protein
MVEQVGIDTCSLRRDVGTNPHGPTRKLIHQFKRPQYEILASAGKQRLQVLQHRRRNQFVASAAKVVEDSTAQTLDACCLGRQRIGQVFR